MEIDNGGVRVHVEAEGPEGAPTVLLIHGLMGALEYWGELPEEITDGRRVLRMDLRGHGRSDRTPGAYQVPGYASDAIAVLEQLTAGPAVVVGHSLGAVTAWHVAQQRPDLVAGAVLEDPPLYAGEQAEFPGSVADVVFPVLRQGVIDGQAAGLDHAGWVARVGASPSGSSREWTIADELTPEGLDARATALSLVDPDAILAACSTETLAPTDTASPVRPPVLLLRADAGMHPAFGPQHAERLARSHPDVEVVEIEGAGHPISASRAARERFLTLLAEFLDRRLPAA
ncbi:MAG TPA: alpha/beta hydrolase [Solirubrobacteraceae bacterium]|nr:alpha/beta hydrolase [Solirubrobacteraceae bacterium]